MPIRTFGFSSFKRSATRRSLPKEGVLVCITTWSYSRASGATRSTVRPSGGASIRRLPGTSAAGWASQVGYQNERISRRAWYRDPGAAIEAFERGRMEEQRSECHGTLRLARNCPGPQRQESGVESD